MTPRRRAGETACAVPATPPPYTLRDETAERGVLAGLLRSPAETKLVVSNVGLAAGDFYVHRHARAFDALMYAACGPVVGDLLLGGWVEFYRRGAWTFDFSDLGEMAVWFYDLYLGNHWVKDIEKWQDADVKDYDAWVAAAAAYKVKRLAEKRSTYYAGVELLKLAFE